MTRYHTDTTHVVASLRNIDDQPATSGTEGRLEVYRTDQVPLVAVDDGEMSDRHLWATIDRTDDLICTIKWERTALVGLLLELHFHESSVENPLELQPIGQGAIDADQATDPRELSDDLFDALHPLVAECGAIFTFAGCEAASIAQAGHFTDFEYEYAIDGVNLDASRPDVRA